MLNRRYLRIKVMQALYSFFQSEEKDIAKEEKQMLYSIERIFDLYLYYLILLVELRQYAVRAAEEGKKKRLPSAHDLNPNMRFAENKVLLALENNVQLQKEAEKRKINWVGEQELIRKIFNTLKSDPAYERYINKPFVSFSEDKKIICELFANHLVEHEFLEFWFEERSIYWVDDLALIYNVVYKGLDLMKEDGWSLLPLYKDEEDDRRFIKELFRKTILNEEENSKVIGDKTKNWDVDRIAMMDILLMKMAITELLHMSNIPVKVTLNEYIEVSKMYSTPKSKVFINGILDKLVVDFKTQNKIVKTGRGLME